MQLRPIFHCRVAWGFCKGFFGELFRDMPPSFPGLRRTLRHRAHTAQTFANDWLITRNIDHPTRPPNVLWRIALTTELSADKDQSANISWTVVFWWFFMLADLAIITAHVRGHIPPTTGILNFLVVFAWLLSPGTIYVFAGPYIWAKSFLSGYDRYGTLHITADACVYRNPSGQWQMVVTHANQYGAEYPLSAQFPWTDLIAFRVEDSQNYLTSVLDRETFDTQPLIVATVVGHGDMLITALGAISRRDVGRLHYALNSAFIDRRPHFLQPAPPSPSPALPTAPQAVPEVPSSLP